MVGVWPERPELKRLQGGHIDLGGCHEWKDCCKRKQNALHWNLRGALGPANSGQKATLPLLGHPCGVNYNVENHTRNDSADIITPRTQSPIGELLARLKSTLLEDYSVRNVARQTVAYARPARLLSVRCRVPSFRGKTYGPRIPIKEELGTESSDPGGLRSSTVPLHRVRSFTACSPTQCSATRLGALNIKRPVASVRPLPFTVSTAGDARSKGSQYERARCSLRLLPVRQRPPIQPPDLLPPHIHRPVLDHPILRLRSDRQCIKISFRKPQSRQPVRHARGLHQLDHPSGQRLARIIVAAPRTSAPR